LPEGVSWSNCLPGDSLIDNHLRQKYFRTLKTLDTFVDRALGFDFMSNRLSGFEYNRELLYAAMANTYLETLGNKADSLHRAIKQVTSCDVYWEYFKTVELLSSKFNFKEHDAVLAFDYTDENFYGDVQGAWIHGWKGDRGVTGKFKFLTCALVSSDIPQKVPLLTIPVHIGHDMSQAVLWILSIVKPLFRTIKLSLFDRGFYSKDLILSLTKGKYQYLIFVPKNAMIQPILERMNESEKKTLNYEFKLNKDKTTLCGSTTLAFLKQIFDPKNEKSFDWVFATNQQSINLDYLVSSYKRRWRIETAFRVQDEARIKSKSTNTQIRFFYFAYEQVLQLLWSGLYKEDVPFKRFVIGIHELCKERNTHDHSGHT